MRGEAVSMLANLVASSVDGILAFDGELRYTLWNPAMERLTGLAAGEVVGRVAPEVFPFLASSGEVGHFRRALAGESSISPERPFVVPETGREGAFEGYYSPLRDEHGRVVGGLAVVRDVTERRRAAEERARLLLEAEGRAEVERANALLRESEERYRAFVGRSSEGIWRFELDEPASAALDPDAQIAHFYRHAYLAECNDAMARMYGYERAEEITGARLADMMPPSDPMNVEYLRAFIAAGYRLEGAVSREVDRDGNVKYFRNNLVGVSEGGLLLRAWGTQQDVTEAKAIEAERERLLEAEREARAAAERALEAHRSVEQRLGLLVEASGVLLGSLRLDDVHPAVLDLSRRLLDADAYAIWRRDGAAGRWGIVSSAGISARYAEVAVQDAAAREWPLERPIVVEDAPGEPALASRRDLYLSEGIRAFIAAPMSIHGEIAATITFYHRAPRRIGDADVRVATGLANLAGAAITGAELFDAQRRSRARAEEAEQRARFMAEASTVLASSLASEETLPRVAGLAVPGLADWCAVDLAGPDGAIARVAVAHADPEKVAWAGELHRRYPPDPSSPHGVPAVLRTGRPELYEEITDAMLAEGARDEEHLRLLRQVGFTSAMVVPLNASGRTLGAITFVNAESGRRFTQDDLAFAADLAARAAVAIENARLFGEAREARERAEEASRMKDEFLAVVSHELRTPLNSMLGWVRLLRSDRLDAAAAARGLETIERNVVSQAQLIEDLLDVSRIVAGKLAMHADPVDLPRVVQTAVDSVRLAAEAKNIRIRAVLDPSAGPVTGDHERLQQVVWNLLANAVKFTPKGGSVTVRLAKADSAVEIAVSDTGQGIPASFLPHVFERFRQADASVTRRHGGLGLGLAIVRHVVELHGGSVRAESEGEGKGATFTVRLPLMPVRRDAPDAAPARPERAAFAGANHLDGVRVLVVDDEEDTRAMLAAVLGECRAEVRTAAGADEALAALDAWAPQVLVSDIGMPGTDGYELMRRVRARPAGAGGQVPAVALTAYARFDDRMKALAAGFQMHVAKPVEPTELVLVIRSLAGMTGEP